MDVRRRDRETSLASVADEVEMEEEGDGAKLFESEASYYMTAALAVLASCVF